VSLLIDALRKAEQQKQAAATPTPSAASGLSLEPLPGAATLPAAAGQKLPELPKRLEELDDQFFVSDPALQKSIRALAESGTRSEPAVEARRPGGDPAAERAAAQNLFAVKAPTTGPTPFVLGVAIATVLAAAAIGGYVYWQMQPRGGLVAGPALPGRTVPPAPTMQAAPIAPPPAQPVAVPTTATALATSPAAAPARRIEPAKQVAQQRSAPPTRERTAPSPAVPPQTAAAATPAASALPPDSVIRPGRAAVAQSAATLEAAHAAFTRGETTNARALWRQTLQTDPRNLDALHGLAAAALQEGQPDQAAALYRRALELDPKDALAHAGLASLGPPADPRQTESRLKTLLAEQPNSPPLNFALGNLYAADARWAEAQQAYFNAHVGEPGNADILYNLAVSLDHLHQPAQAGEYYARALAAARQQPAGFDPAQAEARLKSLLASRPQ